MPELRHGPVVPQVERLLREQVRAGRWRVDDRLPNEIDLARELGVGRSSVREAVRLLARDGVLDVRHGVGTFVADAVSPPADVATMLRRARLREVYEVRRALEAGRRSRPCRPRIRDGTTPAIRTDPRPGCPVASSPASFRRTSAGRPAPQRPIAEGSR